MFVHTPVSVRHGPLQGEEEDITWESAGGKKVEGIEGGFQFLSPASLDLFHLSHLSHIEEGHPQPPSSPDLALSGDRETSL